MGDNTRSFPELADPLGEALYQLRLDGSLYAQSELTAPWGMEMPVLPGKMMFHILTQGEYWIQTGNEVPLLIREGSLVLLPRGRGHRLMSEPGTPVRNFFDLPVQRLSERYEKLAYGGGGPATSLTCCVMSFDLVAGQQLVDQLPELIHIDSWESGADSWLQHSLSLLATEARAHRPGGQTIMANLADILVIQAIRAWLDRLPDTQTGWLAALKDPFVGRSLSAIHQAPQKPWTVESLAREAGLSRAGFSARFTELVGEPVFRYLTRWRMLVARNRLMQERISLGELAEQLGYQSEAAFSRAFKRTLGVSPGAVRKSVGPAPA